jgi:Ig-like domain-containing protein
VAGWATGINPGPANESSQTVSFNITGNSNPSLFAAGPAVSSAGTLTYTPAANANGSAIIALVLQDNGGTGNGGVDTSAAQSFTITVNPVNDAPSFAKGADQPVNQNAGVQAVPGWATAISPGPANEAGQTVSFIITGNSNPGLFAAGPAVNSSGTLTYTPAANANGSATITLVAQDSGGTANGGVDTSAPQSFTITVLPPPPTEAPMITTSPQSQTLALGSSITLFVEASGTPPLLYQWRHNGANIPGATASTYTISGFRLADAGNYSVAVENQFGVAASPPAKLSTILPSAPLNDNFAARSTITTATFTGQGNNRGATKEPGEPNHAGNPGGKSVWFRWTPPVSGIATISTAGSTFDTLLAVYRGSSVSNLTLVVQDDDAGGFFTSRATFNAVAGQSYEVAIDGLGGAEGDIVLDLNVEVTAETLPQIITQPVSRTVPPGATVVLSVVAQAGSPGAVLTYQWFQDGAAIVSATSSNYTIVNVQPVNVGTYTVRVTQGPRSVLSQPAIVQISVNDTGGTETTVAIVDKFAQALQAALSPTGQTPLGGPPPRPPPPVSGYTDTRTFRTVGATKEQGEPNHCGVAGGASQWFFYQAPADGTLTLNTDGSGFDTVMAVYTNRGPVIDFTNLVSVACDNDSGRNGKTSAVSFSVKKDTLYSVAIDGVGAATGTAQLNYQLITPLRFTSWAYNGGRFQLQFVGPAGNDFALQSSTTLTNWTTLLTTNSASGVVSFTDTNSAGAGSRCYRVLQQ